MTIEKHVLPQSRREFFRSMGFASARLFGIIGINVAAFSLRRESSGYNDRIDNHRREVQKILKCSLSFVYKLSSTGRIPSVCIPSLEVGDKNHKHLVRFKFSDVKDFVETHYRQGDK